MSDAIKDSSTPADDEHINPAIKDSSTPADDEHMNPVLRRRIELEVFRLLSNSEIQARNSLVEQVVSYRKFMQLYLGAAMILLGVFVTAASGIFYAYFGKSFDRFDNRSAQEFAALEKRTNAKVDQLVIEYKIAEAYRARIRSYVDAYAGGEALTAIINERVEVAAREEVTSYVEEDLAKLVQQTVSAKVESLQIEEIERILTDALARSTQLNRDVEKLEAAIAAHGEDFKAQKAETERGFLEIRKGLSLVNERIEELVSEMPFTAGVTRPSGRTPTPPAGSLSFGVGECPKGTIYHPGTNSCVPGAGGGK